MVLQNSSVILLVVYYYLLKLGDMITLYFTAKGLWWKSRHRSIAETCLNVILNILLGKTMGINGIILATLISLFLCNYIWSTRIIFREYFGLSRWKYYYLYEGRQTLVNLLAIAVTAYLCRFVSWDNLLMTLMGRAVICVIVPNLIMFLVYSRTDDFRYAISQLIRQKQQQEKPRRQAAE